MDKSKFKKLAMMGMAGGMMMLASQAQAETLVDSDKLQLAQGCGGKGGCSGRSKQTSQTRDDSDIAGCGARSAPIPRSIGMMNGRYTADAQGAMLPHDPNSHPQARMYMGAATATEQTTTTTTTTKSSHDVEKPLTESELLSKLSSEGKTIYQGLNPEGKALALKLSTQFKDKNEAVKAAKKMTEKKTNVNDVRKATSKI